MFCLLKQVFDWSLNSRVVKKPIKLWETGGVRRTGVRGVAPEGEDGDGDGGEEGGGGGGRVLDGAKGTGDPVVGGWERIGVGIIVPETPRAGIASARMAPREKRGRRRMMGRATLGGGMGEGAGYHVVGWVW